MAEIEEKVTVYDIEINATEALKALAELQLQSKELRDAQKALGKITEENAEEYAAYGSQIRAVNARAAQYQKQIQNSIKAQNSAQGSLEQLRTSLSAQTAEYIKLGNTQAELARKSELQESIVATSTAIKQQEEALGDHRRSVGDYEKATVSLRKELKETTDQLLELVRAGERGTEQYEALRQKAADLKTAQSDVNQEINLLSSNTKNFETLAQAVGGVTAAYTVWKSVTKATGEDSAQLEDTIKKLAVAMLAINAVIKIQNALYKTSNTYRTAANLLQKIGINQTRAEAKALAAKNVVMTSGNLITKAAAAATWAWNAALAANPVVLLAAVLLGVGAAIFVFTKNITESTRALKDSEKALKDYTEQANSTQAIIDDLGLRNTKAINAINEARRKEVDELKKSNKTKVQIAQAEFDADQKVRNQTIRTLELQNAQLQSLIPRLKANANAERARLAVLKEGTEKYEAVKKNLLDYEKQLRELDKTIEANRNTIVTTNADILLAATTLATDLKKIRDEATKKALADFTKNSQNLQKLQEVRLRTANQFNDNDVKAQLKYQTDLFNIQQKGEQERLDALRKARQITAKEYDIQNKLLAEKEKQFQNDQLKQLTKFFLDTRNQVAKQLGDTTEQEIAEVYKGLQDSIKRLGEIEIPVRLPGQSDAEYSAALDAYDKLAFDVLKIQASLEKEAARQVASIREKALNDRLKRIDEALDKEYEKDFIKFSNNEEKKLKAQESYLKKQIEQYRQAGKDTLKLENDLAATRAAQRTLQLNREVLEAGKNAGKVYKARKAYLERELADVEENSIRQLEIQTELADLTDNYWLGLISQAENYADAVTSIATNLTNILNSNSDRRLQKVQQQYTREQEALADRYAKGLVSEAEYNAESLKLENKKAREEAKIQREQARRDKALRLFSTSIDIAAGIARAVGSSPLTFGLPWSAFVAATGALQLAAIAAEPLPKAARGAYIRGASHAGGGVNVEAEGGEAIINKRATSMFLPLLSAINQIGGGIPFMDGGYSARSASEGVGGLTGTDVMDAIAEAFANVNIITTVEDIRREDAKYVNIQSTGVF